MKSPYLYLIEVCLCSGVLLVLYKAWFERRIPFRASRIYLLAAVAVSAVIPALRIPVYPVRSVAPIAISQTAGTMEWTDPDPVAFEPVRTADWTNLLPEVLRMGYIVGVLVLVVWFVVRMAAIGRLRRQARLTDCRDYVLAEHATVRTPFSFLRTVYLGEGFDGDRRAIVLRHEASHVRHRHSVERIAMESMLCVLWFNPFAWIAARWLREVQEWEADRDVLDGGCDLTEYRMTLFSQLFGCNPDMTCGLSHSFTKNRFLMMTRNKWGRFAGWRLAAALPFVGGMLCLCSFTTREAETADDKTATIHIAPDGSMTFNGRSVTKDQLLDFIAAEREKLAEPDRKDMTVRIVTEPAKSSNPQISIGADGAVSLDGAAVTLDELETKLKSFRAGLSAEELAAAYVDLTAASSAPMLAVSEVKNVLRRVPFLKLRYNSEIGSVARMLAPLPGGNGKVKVIEAVPDKRNDLLVSVRENGQVKVELTGSSEIIPLTALSGRIADFVSGKIGKAGREVKSFELPDGRTVDYPVSRGVVFVLTSPQTPYDSFVSAQQAVTLGFDSVREAVARTWFDKNFAALTDAERKLVWRAVPANVSEAETRSAGM